MTTRSTTYTARIPAGWSLGHDDSLACPHRDLFVCDACQTGEHAHQIFTVYGLHYWAANATEATELQSMVQ